MWATEMYLILSHLTPGLAGMVSRKMTSSSTLLLMRSMAGPERTPWLAPGGHILGAADLHQGLSRVAQGAARIHHIVQAG